MKFISLILNVAVCCSMLPLVGAQENFSLWPQRPAALEQARRLLMQHQWGEAVHLLQPFVMDSGISGREARIITGRVNVVRYLSRLHPAAAVYTVRGGDNLSRIAEAVKCPVDVIMLYNGMVEPSSLKAGKKLVYVDMSLRVEIYPELKEVTVWDGSTLVASYEVLSQSDGIAAAGTVPSTTVASRVSYLHGKVVKRNSIQVASADKEIQLADGIKLTGRSDRDGRCLRLQQRDVNELALLVREGNQVVWLSSPGTSDESKNAEN